VADDWPTAGRKGKPVSDQHHLTVREAREADLPSLVSLSESVTSERLAWFSNEPECESSFRALFREVAKRPNSIVLVGERGGAVVGELECLARGPHHSEFVISVHSDHRQAGVGSALLRALLQWAESKPELHRLQASVLEPNIGSRHLLDRLGFSKACREPHSTTIRGVTMREFLYHLDFDRR
jgi:RimJ/RimL family protein N-acetyltransferase